MNNAIRIVLTIILFLCLADMPYGYYEFIRFSALIGFAILAFQAHQSGREIEMLICASLALLFQPFFKVALGRELWNIVDIVVGVGLILSIFIRGGEKKA
jgi:hypothetical protein